MKILKIELFRLNRKSLKNHGYPILHKRKKKFKKVVKFNQVNTRPKDPRPKFFVDIVWNLAMQKAVLAKTALEQRFSTIEKSTGSE